MEMLLVLGIRQNHPAARYKQVAGVIHCALQTLQRRRAHPALDVDNVQRGLVQPND